EVAQRQAVDLRLDLLAQHVDDAHHHVVQQPALQPVEQRRDHVHAQHDQQQAAEGVESDALAAEEAVEDDVHRVAQDERRPHRQRGGDQPEGQHDGEAELVAAEGAGQAQRRGPEGLRLPRRALAPFAAHRVLHLEDLVLGELGLAVGALLLRVHAGSPTVIWESTISRKVCELSSSSSWVPRPTIRPSSRTRSWSAEVMEEMRWATMIVVAPRVWRSRPSRTSASVVTSSAEKESSKTYTRGAATRVRAMHRRWRCPPETVVPPWETVESRPVAALSPSPVVRPWTNSVP